MEQITIADIDEITFIKNNEDNSKEYIIKTSTKLDSEIDPKS